MTCKNDSPIDPALQILNKNHKYICTQIHTYRISVTLLAGTKRAQKKKKVCPFSLDCLLSLDQETPIICLRMTKLYLDQSWDLM